MKKYKSHTIAEYLKVLSARSPVPGGGSAAALAAALGVSLISMAAGYSKGKGASRSIEKKIAATLAASERIRKRLLECVDRDARAYLRVVQTRNSAARVKKAALKQARQVPLEVCRLCYSAIQLTPFLVKKGNQNLISDIEVAVELLFAAYKSAMINVAINQPQEA
jgi:formiminotetrahydrofolate cyclodeaminase